MVTVNVNASSCICRPWSRPGGSHCTGFTHGSPYRIEGNITFTPISGGGRKIQDSPSEKAWENNNERLISQWSYTPVIIIWGAVYDKQVPLHLVTDLVITLLGNKGGDSAQQVEEPVGVDWRGIFKPPEHDSAQLHSRGCSSLLLLCNIEAIVVE